MNLINAAANNNLMIDLSSQLIVQSIKHHCKVAGPSRYFAFLLEK